MQITESEFRDVIPVDSYGPGFFRVQGEVHQGPLFLTGRDVVAWSGLEDIAPLVALAGQVDVLFVGMGAGMAFLPADLKAALAKAGVPADPMPTPSACKTYNVLLSEGRRVAVAALPV